MRTRVGLAALLLAACAGPACACPACVNAVSAAPSGVLLGLVSALFAGLLVWPSRAKVFVSFGLFLLIFGIGDIQQSYPLIAASIAAMQVGLVLLDRRLEGRALRRAVAALSVVTFLGLCLLPRATFSTINCRFNLIQLKQALDIYSADNGNRFPPSLGRLVPTCIPVLPRCYQGSLSDANRAWFTERNGFHFGDYTYVVSPRADAYTVTCNGRNHIYWLQITQKDGPSVVHYPK